MNACQFRLSIRLLAPLLSEASLKRFHKVDDVVFALLRCSDNFLSVHLALNGGKKLFLIFIAVQFGLIGADHGIDEQFAHAQFSIGDFCSSGSHRHILDLVLIKQRLHTDAVLFRNQRHHVFL